MNARLTAVAMALAAGACGAPAPAPRGAPAAQAHETAPEPEPAPSEPEPPPSTPPSAPQLVASTGPTPTPFTLALDSSGRPHLGFLDRAEESLKHAMPDGDRWQVEVVDQGASGGEPGWLYPSFALAVDAASVPHFVYGKLEGWAADRRTARLQLHLASRPSSAWSTETFSIGAVGRGRFFLTAAASGELSLVVSDEASRRPRWARRQGGAWALVGSLRPGGGLVDVAFDPEGAPQAVLFDVARAASPDGAPYSVGRLLHAAWDAARGVGIDPRPSLGETACAATVAGEPVIVFVDLAEPGTVNVARREAGAWTVERVDTVSWSSTHCALAVGSDGTAWIAYSHGEPETLRIARRDAGGWRHADVETGPVYYPRLAVDGSSGAHVAYLVSPQSRPGGPRSGVATYDLHYRRVGVEALGTRD